MPVDIFPQVGDPAIYVAQPYGGMDPAQMEGYLTYYYEYHFLYITGIEHVESKSIQGAALMKLVFHQGTDMSQAMAETVGYVNRARAFMPPGTVPPFITRFDAGSVPSASSSSRSPTHTQGEMQDFRAEPRAAAVRDAAGRLRAAAVRRQPAHHRRDARSRQAARSTGSRPTKPSPPSIESSLVMPSGNMRTGKLERIARTNAALGGNLPDLLDTPDPRRLRAPPSICATSAPSRTAPTSSPPTRTSTASAPSTSRSPSAPTPPRSP